jgi:hypothetical protein
MLTGRRRDYGNHYASRTLIGGLSSTGCDARPLRTGCICAVPYLCLQSWFNAAQALTGGNISGVALGSLSPAYTALEQGIGEDGGLGDDGGQHHGAFAEAMSVFISHRTHQVVDSHCSLSLSLSLSLALSIPPSPPPRSHASLSTLYLPYWTFNCAEITKAKKHQ